MNSTKPPPWINTTIGSVGAAAVQRRNRGLRLECGVAGCPRPAAARGLGKAHWARQHRTGDPALAMIVTKARPYEAGHPCAVPGCAGSAHTRQLYKRHYDQQRRAKR